jgi:hypothetical protein
MDLGPAMQARGGAVERVGGRMSSTAQRKAKPVMARHMPAENLFEVMGERGQLSDRQVKAGQRLWMLKRAAGIEQRVTAKYPVVPEQMADDQNDVEVLETICPEGFDPRTYYRAVLRDIPSRAASLLDHGCDWTPDHRVGHPGIHGLDAFQLGLDRLAATWGVKD